MGNTLPGLNPSAIHFASGKYSFSVPHCKHSSLWTHNNWPHCLHFHFSVSIFIKASIPTSRIDCKLRIGLYPYFTLYRLYRFLIRLQGKSAHSKHSIFSSPFFSEHPFILHTVQWYGLFPTLLQPTHLFSALWKPRQRSQSTPQGAILAASIKYSPIFSL